MDNVGRGLVACPEAKSREGDPAVIVRIINQEIIFRKIASSMKNLLNYSPTSGGKRE